MTLYQMMVLITINNNGKITAKDMKTILNI